MCVIYTCNTKLPSDDELRRGAQRNSDGAGLSWLGPDPEDPKRLTVFWQKGLKDDESVKKFIRENNVPFPLIIHFRTASVGGNLSELTHPFPTVQDAPLWEAGHAPEVLFHNGHVTNWDDLVLSVGLPSNERFPDGPWSDTRALAWLTYLKGPGVLDFIIKSSRVALMHCDANTLVGEEYDRADDHITHFGAGWISGDGFRQSISTGSVISVSRGYQGYRGVHDNGAYMVDDDDDTDVCNDAAWARLASERVKEPEVKSLVPSTSNIELNIWTVEELLSIITQLEEAQVNAKLAAGI